MPRTISAQTSFTAGELDPRLTARHDYDGYYKGAETLTNVICLPQGGIKRRPGLKYIATHTESAVRMVTFEFSTTQTYLLVFVNAKMYVYKDGVLQTNINGSGNDYLVTPWTTAQIQEMDWTQSADTLIVAHNAVAPRKITRGASHTTWSISTISFTESPTYDFNQDYDALTFTPSVASPVGGTVTLTASGGTSITTEHDNGMFEGNGGIVRITSVNVGAQTFAGEILKEFTNTNAIDGDKASLEEPAWTSEHGYPGAVTFHEARLWFSNSTNRPQTLWGSVTGDFWNFDRGIGDDDDSIEVTMDTDQVNAVKHLVSGRHLQIFTTGGEFYASGAPLRPSSIGVTRQTRFGAMDNVRPLNIDGATMFVQRNGKQVREFLFTYTEDSYVSTEVNLLAPHLVNSPVAMAGQSGDVTNEGNYLYVVNGDGTVAVLNTNRSEEVTAWTKYTTTGTVKDVAVVEDIPYFFIERTINSVTVYHIEALDHSYYTDAGIIVTNSPASATVSGLGHLDGEECRVKADGAVMPNATPSSGSITLSRTASSIEVGLGFNPTIKTMPVNLNYGSGPIRTRKRRIVRATAVLHNSTGVYIDGKELADRSLGTGVLGAAPVEFSGVKETPLLGYSRTAQVTITQQDPLPMTLLGVTLEVQATG